MDNNIKEFLNNKKNIFNLIKNKNVLFHSGTSELNDIIKSDGIIPQKGKWLQQILNGAVDSEEHYNEVLENSPDIAFYSKDPSWISMKVALKLNKSVSEVSWNDITEHGQLSIVLYEEYDEYTFKHAINLEGHDFIEHSYYLNSNEIADYEIPFGVEKGDIYTEEEIVPDYTLTGSELVNFLKTHYPNCNIVKKEKNIKKNTP